MGVASTSVSPGGPSTASLPTWRVLARSAIGAQVAGSSAEEPLAQIKIPGGMMGPNGMLRVTATWSGTNNGNNKTLRFRFGGIGGTAYCAATITTSLRFRHQTEIANRGFTNSQVGVNGAGGGWTTDTAAPITSAIDTTVDQTLAITGQKATGTDTLILESYVVEILADGT